MIPPPPPQPLPGTGAAPPPGTGKPTPSGTPTSSGTPTPPGTPTRPTPTQPIQTPVSSIPPSPEAQGVAQGAQGAAAVVVPTTPLQTGAAASPSASPSSASKRAHIPLSFLMSKDAAKSILEGEFTLSTEFQEISTYISQLSYIVEEKKEVTRNFTIGLKMNNDQLPDLLATLWIIGQYKEANDIEYL